MGDPLPPQPFREWKFTNSSDAAVTNVVVKGFVAGNATPRWEYGPVNLAAGGDTGAINPSVGQNAYTGLTHRVVTTWTSTADKSVTVTAGNNQPNCTAAGESQALDYLNLTVDGGAVRIEKARWQCGPSTCYTAASTSNCNLP